MILAILVATSRLLLQAVEDGTPPQIDIKPDQTVLNTVLSIPSVKVSRSESAGGNKYVGAVFQVGGKVTPPRVHSQVPPEFPEKNRKAKQTGTVIIRAIVGRTAEFTMLA